MSCLWFFNANVVLPDQILKGSSLLCKNGQIVATGAACPPDAEPIDACGGWLLPGFIDIHLHGGGGADVMDATPEAFRTIAQSHCAHGTTALVPTTMTCEDELLKKVIACYAEASQQDTGGADLLGLHLEGPFFSQAAKGAQPVDGQRIPEKAFLEEILALGKGHILRWDAAPELENMDLFAQVMQEHGVLCTAGHTFATAAEALQAYEWGFSHVTHFYNVTSTFHKKNGLVYSGVVEATYLSDDVTIELIADGRHIPRESMLLAHRIKGADRIALITDAMRAACTDDTYSILGAKEGGVPVAIRDGVAQLTDFSAYAGSICTMDRALRVAHLEYGLPLADVSRMLSLTPARLCGCADRKGSLEPGKDADLVLLTPDFDVQQVYVRGIRRH